MKFIPHIIFITSLFSQPINDSMNINYIPVSTESSAMGGIYIPFNIDEKIAFSHLSRFGGMYRLDAMQYKNILITIHGVDDIPNTMEAWINVDDDGPEASEIDYSKINYFDVKDYNLIVSKIVNDRYNFSVKNTISKIYNRFGYGFGLNIVTTKKTSKFFDYYIGIYDLAALKIWNDSNSFNTEFYEPKIMISLERSFLKSLNILTLYGFYKGNEGWPKLDYRFGSKITLTNNLEIFLGKSAFNKFSCGFSINNNLFNIDYSYIISEDNLPFEDSYNIGISIKISELIKKSKDFYP